MKCIVVTNNHAIIDRESEFKDKIEEIIYIDSLNILEVFYKVRDKVHQGHILLTHPLSGSVKPSETPFKSIAISKETHKLDVESLYIIEDAIEMAVKLIGDRTSNVTYDPDIIEDFSVIDYGLIKNGLESLGGNYVKGV